MADDASAGLLSFAGRLREGSQRRSELGSLVFGTLAQKAGGFRQEIRERRHRLEPFDHSDQEVVIIDAIALQASVQGDFVRIGVTDREKHNKVRVEDEPPHGLRRDVSQPYR